jgi:uncharacterized protein YggE
MSVQGETEEHVKPDLALSSLEAVDERPTAAAAAVENAHLAQALIAAVRPAGRAAGKSLTKCITARTALC